MTNNQIMSKLFFLIPIFFHLCVLVNGQNTKKDIEVRVLTDLAFGSFVTGSTGGTVVISPGGSRSVTAPVIGLALSQVSSAEFEITTQGKPTIQFNIDEPAYLYRSGGSESIMITNFTTDKTSPFSATGGNKPDIVRVGATLHVQNSALNPPGNYTGTFSVTFIRD
jgi:hypothetical protein